MTIQTVHALRRPEGSLEYDVTGDGPLVVCLPGMGELRGSYRFTVPALAGAGFRVATLDLRGHGGSDATFSRYDDVAAGADVLALIEEQGGPAVVVGNSMGAGAAVLAAAERPDLVSGLVLVGPFVRNAPMNPLLALAFRAAMSGPWAPAVWGRYLPSLYPGCRPDDFTEHRDAIRASMRLPGHAKAFAATTRTSHAPAEAHLAEVTAPALVVMGGADPDFRDPIAEADWIADQLGAEKLLVPEAGHYPQTEYPDRVNPALVDFCSRVLRDA
ncbi:MAG TPA: alpha/beta hydrolase [Nocardioidaceae bacterium]|nr:alpha/beta hydrolase [Nocardioidaceae bacterium]